MSNYNGMFPIIFNKHLDNRLSILNDKKSIFDKSPKLIKNIIEKDNISNNNNYNKKSRDCNFRCCNNHEKINCIELLKELWNVIYN